MSATALGLVAAELTARLTDDRLPQARIWHDPVAQVKHRALIRRRARGLTGGTVFAGSSQVLEGIRPSLAAPASGPCVYNAALHRSFLPLTEPWLQDVVLPLARPHLVVLGLSVLDLNDNGVAQHEVVRRFERSVARRQGLMAACVRTTHQRSAAARVALGGVLPSFQPRSIRIGPEGEGTEFADAVEYRLSERKRAYIEQDLIAEYHFGDETAVRLRRVVSAIREAGSEVVFLEMPVTDELVRMLPSGDRTIEATRNTLRERSRELAVRLIEDLRVMEDHRWFADCVHFNGRGMTEASHLVAEALGRLDGPSIGESG